MKTSYKQPYTEIVVLRTSQPITADFIINSRESTETLSKKANYEQFETETPAAPQTNLWDD